MNRKIISTAAVALGATLSALFGWIIVGGAIVRQMNLFHYESFEYDCWMWIAVANGFFWFGVLAMCIIYVASKIEKYTRL